MNERILNLATRKSKLAVAQSSMMARLIEKHNPGVKVVLKLIVTQGDKVQDIPLSQMDGKDFFVKELDEALLEKRADLTVHSMKDLSVDRPQGIVTAAISKRSFPHDVIVFNESVFEKIGRGEPIVIGTSAPRRLENVPPFLKKALPTVKGHQPEVEFSQIRGNVDTRLGRLKQTAESGKYLDGVVLALAGLDRLNMDTQGSKTLKGLLQGCKWMVLPISECAAAPAQGALAIECRSNDDFVLAALKKIHCEKTAVCVGNERDVLKKWGGGCHQKFGATQIVHPLVGPILFSKGESDQGFRVDGIKWDGPDPVDQKTVIWDGIEKRSKAKDQVEVIPQDLTERDCIFAAHSRALDFHADTQVFMKKRLWVSGTKSWFKLAARGIWVEGCGDSLGNDYLFELMSAKVLGLSVWKDWAVYTHQDAVGTWNNEEVLASYKIPAESIDQDNLASATHIFWGSGSQYERLKSVASSKAAHACGVGKTAEVLLKDQVHQVKVFPSVDEWRKWIGVDHE